MGVKFSERRWGVSEMRRATFFGFIGLAGCLLFSTAALAGRNTADYPLRVHIFQFNSHSHYAYQTVNFVDGEGRANLYENSQPRGFDFSYRCQERLRSSAGYETYPARWKKPNQSLEILLPQFGKPGAYEACEMKVNMKDTAYYRHNGGLDEEPAPQFKAWMDKHGYDPEHGKDEPVPVTPTQPAGAAPGASAPRQDAP